MPSLYICMRIMFIIFYNSHVYRPSTISFSASSDMLINRSLLYSLQHYQMFNSRRFSVHLTSHIYRKETHLLLCALSALTFFHLCRVLSFLCPLDFAATFSLPGIPSLIPVYFCLVNLYSSFKSQKLSP